MAFAKMINVGANWANPTTVMTITGKECYGGYFHPTNTLEKCTTCTPTTGCPATGTASGCICK